MKVAVERFESSRLRYREISDDDAETIVRWRSNPLIYRHFRNPEPLTLQKHIEWYRYIYFVDSTRIDYIISEKQHNTPIGIIVVSDMQEHTLQIGYLIGEMSYQKKGFAAEAINAIINKYCKLGIYGFFAEIRFDNVASLKTIEKCGFSYIQNTDSDFVLYHKEISI